MRLLRILLPLLVFLVGSATAKADYNPTNPPEPGVYYTLTTRCVPEGSGYNLTASGTYAFGSSISMHVNGNTGFRFVQWEDEEGKVVATNRTFTYTMPTHDVALTARFVYDPSNPEEPSTPEFKDSSEIKFEIYPAEAGNFQGSYDGSYQVGSTHNFTVSARTNYRFVNWTRNGVEVGTSRTLSYTVPKGDHIIVANFEYSPANPEEPGEQHFYRKLRLESNPSGATSTLSGAGEYLDGSRQYVYARKNDFYTFVNWTDDLGDVVSESSDFYYTMPNRNVTLTANYTYCYNPSSPGEPGTPNPGGSVGENMVLWPRIVMFDDSHVQILCETPGSTIHYTLDGTNPTSASPIYTEPVFVGSNLTVKAIAFKEGMEDSPIVTYKVTSYHAAAPVFTFENRKIKITSETPGAVIRYTLDFSEPNEESEIYTEPFVPEENCRIKAYASKEGLTDSSVSFYVYRRAEHILPAPTFSLNNEWRLVITPAVIGGITRYTTDGTDPDENSAVYTAPLTIPGKVVVKAYTTHINYFDSPIGEYVSEGHVVEKLPTPTASYAGHHLFLDCEDPDALIHYTTNGEMPTASSALYTDSIPMTGDCTVRFFAIREGFDDSDENRYKFVLSDWQETPPAIRMHYREKYISVEHPDSLDGYIEVMRETGPDGRYSTIPYTFGVEGDMKKVSAYTRATTPDRYASDPVEADIVFHLPPRINYNGHEFALDTEYGEPYPEVAEGWTYFNGNFRGSGALGYTTEVLEFGVVSAHLESDYAFPSDDAFLEIDCFNTGRMAGARYGHRLAECFGTWGDTPEDYTYLRVRGEVEKEDLQHIATLPNLTTLHLDPYTMTTEDCDNVFADTSIETIFSVGYPKGMLKGMPRLTTVMWGLTNAKMPPGRIKEAGNPNILFWTTDEDNAPADAGNIVTYDYIGEGFPTDPDARAIRGHAKKVVLEDGFPFNAHMPLTADSAVFTKSFRQPTQIGVCRGWETIALPFRAETITHEMRGQIQPFATWDGEDLSPKPFWLYRASTDGWEPTGNIEAGEPYIISMPNNPEYIDEFNLDGKVRFGASYAELGQEWSMPRTSDWVERLIFEATFMPVESRVRSLNVNGEGNALPGSIFTERATTLPFGCYVAGGDTRMAIPVFGNWSGVIAPTVAATGVAVDSPSPGCLRISSPAACSVAINTTTGATVARAEIAAGETVCIDGLTKGLYIAAGMKVMVK